MGHVLFIIIHILALLFGIVGLIITIPLHLIYSRMGGKVVVIEGNTVASTTDSTMRTIFIVLAGMVLLYFYLSEPVDNSAQNINDKPVATTKTEKPKEVVEKIYMKVLHDSNLYSKPNPKNYDGLILKIPKYTEVEIFEGRSIIMTPELEGTEFEAANRVVWYKATYEGKTGWVSEYNFKP